MNRIDSCFSSLREKGRKGLVAFLTAGDPDIETSEANIREVLSSGADIMEVGVPFSDPTADGPVIQAAGQRALSSGVNLDSILEMATRIRRDFDQPMILFSYVNPLFSYGIDRICGDARQAGFDGFLTVDVPFEEADGIRASLEKNDLAFIPLIAPTTSPARMQEILRVARGFVYYIMVKGVTGARSSVAVDVESHVEEIRKHTSLPIAAGFGVSNGPQAAEAARVADAVVVGSALVEAAREGRLGVLVEELVAAI